MIRKSLSLFIALSLLLCLTSPSLGQGKGGVIIYQTIDVDPGTYRMFPFGSAEGHDIKITGAFRANGGKNNDIEVYIFDEDECINWENGNPAKSYYNSGRVTVAKLNLTIPSGRYVLVFSNKFSTFSIKSVGINILIGEP